MTAVCGPPTVRGRTLGGTLLVAIQLLVGVVHVVFGLWLFTASPTV
jgi:hypothetical protein